MTAENYYEMLGLKKGAGDEAVKQAFRELAKTLHPDRNPGDPEAERRFKLITTAYEALKDESRRRAYDEWLAFARKHERSHFGQWGRLAALLALLLIGPSLALYWASVFLRSPVPTQNTVSAPSATAPTAEAQRGPSSAANGDKGIAADAPLPERSAALRDVPLPVQKPQASPPLAPPPEIRPAVAARPDPAPQPPRRDEAPPARQETLSAPPRAEISAPIARPEPPAATARIEPPVPQPPTPKPEAPDALAKAEPSAPNPEPPAVVASAEPSAPAPEPPAATIRPEPAAPAPKAEPPVVRDEPPAPRQAPPAVTAARPEPLPPSQDLQPDTPLSEIVGDQTAAQTPAPPVPAPAPSSPPAEATESVTPPPSERPSRQSLRDLTGADEGGSGSSRNAPGPASRQTAPLSPNRGPVQTPKVPYQAPPESASRNMARMIAALKEQNTPARSESPAARGERRAALPYEQGPPSRARTRPLDPDDFADCEGCPVMSVVATRDIFDRGGTPGRSRGVRRSLAISKYEVTVREWNACVEDGACQQSRDGRGARGDQPVRDVAPQDAADYADWLTEKTGKSYRLLKPGGWARPASPERREAAGDGRRRDLRYRSGDLDDDYGYDDDTPPEPFQTSRGFRVTRTGTPDG